MVCKLHPLPGWMLPSADNALSDGVARETAGWSDE